MQAVMECRVLSLCIEITILSETILNALLIFIISGMIRYNHQSGMGGATGGTGGIVPQIPKVSKIVKEMA